MDKSVSGLQGAFTAGYLLDYLHDYHQEIVWREIAKGLEHGGHSLISFVGQPFGHGRADDHEATNRIFDLAQAPWIAGFFLHAETMGFDISADSFREYIHPFRQKPCISIGPSSDNMPSVLVEGRTGVIKLVEHLVNHHKRQHIAFIGGVEASVEAQERLAAYREGLRAAGLPFNNEYIFTGDFWLTGGQNAIRAFLDERKLPVDAVIAANDFMALGALRELKARGVRIPQDISLAGFDDVLEAEHEHPALTSVRWPLKEQARRALEMLQEQLSSGETLRREPLSTIIVPRRSCGCEAAEMTLADMSALADSPENASYAKPPTISFDAFAHTRKTEQEELLQLCREAVESTDFASFQEKAEEYIHQGLQGGDSAEDWQNFLSKIRIALLPETAESPKNLFIESSISKLRILVGSLEAKRLKLQISQASIFSDNLGVALKEISAARSFEELGTLLQDKMQGLGLRSFYFAAKDQIRAEGGAELLADSPFTLYTALCDSNDLLAQRRNVSFKTADFIPRQFLPSRPCNLIALPLCFGKNFYGIAIYEPGPDDTSVYTRINDQIGTTIHDILLMEAEKETEQAIMDKTERIVAMARPITHAVLEVSKIVNEEAASVESTGEAARKMKQDILEAQTEIANMAERVKKIREYTAVIEDISETIKLLGLNAAIEAARAGSMGKGFNVIASEIRKLAESAGENAQGIGQALGELSSETARSVASVTHNAEAFQTLDGELQQMLEVLKLISRNMIQLSGSSRELMDSLQQEDH